MITCVFAAVLAIETFSCNIARRPRFEPLWQPAAIFRRIRSHGAGVRSGALLGVGFGRRSHRLRVDRNLQAGVASVSPRDVQRPLIASVAGRRRNQPPHDTIRRGARPIHPCSARGVSRVGLSGMFGHRLRRGWGSYVNSAEVWFSYPDG